MSSDFGLIRAIHISLTLPISHYKYIEINPPQPSSHPDFQVTDGDNFGSESLSFTFTTRLTAFQVNWFWRAEKKETTFQSREISCDFKGKINNYLIETIDGMNAMVSAQYNNQPLLIT